MAKPWAAVTIVAALLAGATSTSAQSDASLESASGDSIARPVELFIGLDGIASGLSNGGDLRFSVGIPKGNVSLEFFGGVYQGGALSDFGEDFLGTLYRPTGVY